MNSSYATHDDLEALVVYVQSLEARLRKFECAAQQHERSDVYWKQSVVDWGNGAGYASYRLHCCTCHVPIPNTDIWDSATILLHLGKPISHEMEWADHRHIFVRDGLVYTCVRCLRLSRIIEPRQ